MLAAFAWLVLGLALLLAGGEALVRGATAIARIFRVPELVIGLTLVAFGTSAPELVVNVVAGLGTESGLRFGNVVGSNIANVSLLLAAAALIRPLRVQASVIMREIPMMVLAAAAGAALALDAWHTPGAPDLFDRGDGIVLLLLFGVFLYYTIGDIRVHRARESMVDLAQAGGAAAAGAGEGTSGWRAALFSVGGFAGLVAGGNLTVDACVEIARGFGVSESMIGLTILAVGTSLPELAASGVAAYRGHGDIAVGNVVGSNIFNILLIGGVSALIRPMDVPATGTRDLLVMLAVSLLLLPIAVTHRRTITRGEGALLVAVYAGYLALVLTAG